tara:strand:- start:4197 stop:5330 length:1134 start_codon:yes stop_codon:yes gene_type:complete
LKKKLLTMINNKIVIIAGEDSGDLHGSKLIAQMKTINPDLSFYGIGGDKMIQAGLNKVEHIKNMNVIGLFEVLKHYPRIKRIFNKTVRFINELKPNKVILIDYPGFNIRLAKKMKKLGIPVSYFILPQVWAWNSSRAKDLQQTCKQLISIIPFEKEWFSNQQIDVHFVGHPLTSILKQKFDSGFLHKRYEIGQDKKIIALLPGSRTSEVKKHWPIFLKTIKAFNASSNHKIQPILIQAPNIKIENVPEGLVVIDKNHYEALSCADAAIVCSGTATLETALLNCPMVVCYKLSSLTWFFAKKMSLVKHLSLVNLITEKEAVKELLQKNMTATNIVNEVNYLFSNEGKDAWAENYSLLLKKMNSETTNPYHSAAKHILQ